MVKYETGFRETLHFYLMKIILFIACILYLSSTYAQSYNPEKVNAKAKLAYDKAVEFLQYGQAKEALPFLLKAVEFDKGYEDALLSIGAVYNELKDYKSSVEYYEKAFAIDNDYAKYFYNTYSISLAGLGKFEDALNAINKFLAIPKLNEKSIKSAAYRKNSYQFAVDYASAHAGSQYVFTPKNLGDKINSSKSEYYPSFTIDDSILVYTRREAGIEEDFIKSSLGSDGYTNGAMIQGSINEEPSKGAVNISQDGEWLVFAGNFPQKGFGDFDIYMSYNTPQGWSAPINMGADVNSEFWDSGPSISPDKNTLYFSSNRPGGFGGSDIYVCFRQPNGKWSEAINMGAGINTAGDDQAPFIHADNQTLYFTSNGLPGYGGSDLYVLRKDASGKWNDKPENLGYPVNTIENEGSLFVASNGEVAYYASDRADSYGGLDLYSFELRQDIKPLKTLYLKGYVTDTENHHGLPCSVELTNDADIKTVSRVQTDETGFYFIAMPAGNNYTVTVNRKGYLFYSDTINLSQKDALSTTERNIALQPVKLNASVTLKNIQFALNSFQLEPVSMIELDKLLQLMNDNPSITIQVNGHTDNTGNAAANITLSQNRAKAVVNYLIQKGIEAKRITFKGFGSLQPVADNSTEEGRAANRRTEFIITGL